MEDNTYSETVNVGAFSVLATSSKTVSVKTLGTDANISSEEGVEFTKALSLGGTGNATYRCIKFTLTSAAKVSVYARSGGDTDRTLKVVDDAGTEITTLTAVGKANTVLSAASAELSAGTYYIYSAGSGIDVYDIQIKSNLKLDLSNTEAKEYTEDFTAGDFSMISGGNKMTVKDISSADAQVSSDDGQTFTRALILQREQLNFLCQLLQH